MKSKDTENEVELNFLKESLTGICREARGGGGEVSNQNTLRGRCIDIF